MVSLALDRDSPAAPVPVPTSAPTAAPSSPPPAAPTAAPSATSSPTPTLTEAQVLDDLNKQKNTADLYSEAQKLADQAQNDKVALQAVLDAFNARIVAPAAKQIADAYSKGGAMGAAASLLKAMKEAPPGIAASIFEAAKPTVDAISQELGGTVFASKFLLPQSTSASVTGLRKDQQDGIPRPYPDKLWKIASQDEFKSVYGDLSAAVEIAGRGPDSDSGPGEGNDASTQPHLSAAAQQVADSIMSAVPYQAKDSPYFPSSDNVDSNALMSSAVTNAVSNGDGAALSLALAKRSAAVPAPSSANGTSTVLGPPPRLDSKQLLGAIGTAVQTLHTNNDKAVTDFTTPAPELVKLAERWGGLAGDDAAGEQELQQALAKTIDQTPSLADPLKARQEKVDQTAGDVAGALLDVKHAATDLQGVAGFDTLAQATTDLQKDKKTTLSIGVSDTAQSAIINAQLQELAKQNPSFSPHGKPPNLLWDSRIARGLIAEIAAMKIPAKPEGQVSAALANISRMQPDERQQFLTKMADIAGIEGDDRKKLVSGTDMGAIQKWLGGADLSVQADAVTSAANAMTDAGKTPITARGGFAPTTPMGKAMTGLGTALYLVGAWDLIDTPVLPGQNPVPAHINQAFGYYVLWGAVNNGYMNASSWAQTLLVGENSKLFKDKFPVDGLLDRATRPAVGRGTLFEVSGDLFDVGAGLLLGGITAYDIKHGNYVDSLFHGGMATVGSYPVAAKYGPRIPQWLAGNSQASGAGDVEAESLAAETVAEEALTEEAAAGGSAAAGGAAAGGAAAGGVAVGGAAAEGTAVEGAAVAAAEGTAGEGAAAVGGASLGGPISTVGMLAIVTGQFFWKKYVNESRAAKMEPFNRTFLRNFGYSPEQAKAMANDDQYGNSVGPTWQVTAARLGISGKQMGDYLRSIKDPSKLNGLVLATQNVNADAKGNYQVTLLDHDDAIPDAPAGLSGLALKGFYEQKTQLFQIPTLTSQFGQPPLNADNGYFRKVALERETPHSIDGLIQWAKDDGIPFPTAASTGGTPTPTPTPTPNPTPTPTPTPSSGPTPTPTPGPAPTPPTPTPSPGASEPPDPHGNGKTHTPTPAPTERDITVQDGDTLTGLAASNGTTLPGLVPLNPEFDWALLGFNAAIQGQRDPNFIFPGDIIHIPIPPR